MDAVIAVARLPCGRLFTQPLISSAARRARATRQKPRSRRCLSASAIIPQREGSCRDLRAGRRGLSTSFIEGYEGRPADVLDRTSARPAGYDDFALIRDISFTSHCEHYMMPFYGKRSMWLTRRPQTVSSACRSSRAWSTSPPAACRRRSSWTWRRSPRLSRTSPRRARRGG